MKLSLRLGAAVLVATTAAVGCGGGGERASTATTRPDGTTTTVAVAGPTVDDRRTAAGVLPDVTSIGAGWVELNRDPGGPDDPTLPTGPEITADCGGDRAVRETGAAFVLFEKRRLSDLDEQLFVFGLLFPSAGDAGQQANLFRSDRLEGCVHASLTEFLAEFDATVTSTPIAIPEGVAGTGTRLWATVEAAGRRFEGGVQFVVLHRGRGVVLVVHEVIIGAPASTDLVRLVSEVDVQLSAVLAQAGHDAPN